ncbi:hypothetical protein Busp01_12120 [Trinickia caryophylli]|uniref:Putative flippase GtrA (Transmembrane translocase of bactoprenol-linked glucose) n=2 Tax=Trinickia caryophylli TaxID=28094 RepID=A0A1X7D8F2_TRICW|nr:GtrA family protein [Trinickia caryophylli]TRX15046.1 GtrA family protein [Trinickia caryophylli]GLU31370.1 hypothetical protein Busp01_12120 [Trinickia caryophylli]SMF10303.1 Putative flippase GtrA (transmembrane translocase of bactoprenol-linked glucose) [Trinickia caryophylli]
MLAQFMRFGVVGALGTLVNLAVFALLVEHWHVDHNVGACAAFLAAVTHNYAINRAWTFRSHGRPDVSRLRGLAKYAGVNLLGFCVGLIGLNAVVLFAGPAFSLQGQALGIVMGMGFNFLLARQWVFKARRVDEGRPE